MSQQHNLHSGFNLQTLCKTNHEKADARIAVHAHRTLQQGEEHKDKLGVL